jgi:hypothetical protein
MDLILIIASIVSLFRGDVANAIIFAGLVAIIYNQK